MLFAGVLAIVLAAAAGWADAALSPPGQPDFLHSAYAPVEWTQHQHGGMRRRVLLQQASGGLAVGAGLGGIPWGSPVCELMLSYRVVDLGPFNFSSIVTLTNHREVRLRKEAYNDISN